MSIKKYAIRNLLLTQTVIFLLVYAFILLFYFHMLHDMGMRLSVVAVRWFLYLLIVFVGITPVLLILNKVFSKTNIKRKWLLGAVGGFSVCLLSGLILTICHGGPPTDYMTDASILLEGLLLPGYYVSYPISMIFHIGWAEFSLPWPDFIIILISSGLFFGFIGALMSKFYAYLFPSDKNNA